MSFDFEAHLQRQREWSERTFGPDPRAAGIIDHITKELKEVAAAPHDLSEWVDVAILAFDGAWRAGFSPGEIIAALIAKQAKNEAREWPDWRTMPTDKAIEHDRSKDTAPVFKVGDCVRIARKVERFADGSDADWDSIYMDETIGVTGDVFDVDAPRIHVRLIDGGEWYYAAEALDRLP